MTAQPSAFAQEDPPTLIRRRRPDMERRAAVRLPIEMEVHVEGAAQRYLAVTGDFSPGGMFVVTQRQMPVGTQVMLSFTLPNGVAVEVLGVVKWHGVGGVAMSGSTRARGAGIGLAFFCLEPAVKAMLQEYCANREPLYYGH
jgi:Tfp pilus assembly protein PilZ